MPIFIFLLCQGWCCGSGTGGGTSTSCEEVVCIPYSVVVASESDRVSDITTIYKNIQPISLIIAGERKQLAFS